MESSRNYNLKRLATIGVLTALSVVFSLLIRFPLLPAAPYLEYDAGDIPIMIGSFLYGPFAAIIMTTIVVTIQGVTVSAASGIWGIIMHFIASICFTLPAGIIYNNKRTFKVAVIGIVVGYLLSFLSMIFANLAITPIYTGLSTEAVSKMILPIIVPFNLIKLTINSVATLLIYKKLKNVLEKFFNGIESKINNRKKIKGKKRSINFIEDEPINHRAYLTHSEQDTIEFGETYALERLQGGEVILLEGNLGSGKTTFTKGIALGLGIKEEITSPTFNILKEYSGSKLKLYHFDMYRFEREEEIEETGVSEALDADGVCVIEWNKFDLARFKGKVVKFSFLRVNDTTRKIEMEILKRK